MLAFNTACVLNEGLFPVLKIFETTGVIIGPNSHSYADKVNSAQMYKTEHLNP